MDFVTLHYHKHYVVFGSQLVSRFRSLRRDELNIYLSTWNKLILSRSLTSDAQRHLLADLRNSYLFVRGSDVDVLIFLAVGVLPFTPTLGR